MNNTYTPQTEVELETWMKENCYNFNGYSINGNAIFEGFGIDKSGEIYNWYYTERGQKEPLKHFQSEAEIVAHAYNQIKSDKWAKTHCIGFTTSKEEKNELESLLENADIAFLQDEIPYYGPERPVYRIFVFGCDFNQTKHLKDKYHKEK